MLRQEKYLKLAYEKWGNDDSPLAIRNIAFAELVSHFGLLSYCSEVLCDLTWDKVKFTDKPRIDIFVWKSVSLTPQCAAALYRWLEVLWSYHSKSMRPFPDEVFCREIADSPKLSAAEHEFRKLELSEDEADEIHDLLFDYENNKKREARERKKQAKKTIKVEPVSTPTINWPVLIVPPPPVPKRAEAPGVGNFTSRPLPPESPPVESADVFAPLSVFQQDSFFYPTVAVAEERKKARRAIRAYGFISADQLG